MTVNLKGVNLDGSPAASATRKTSTAHSLSKQSGETTQHSGPEVSITSTASMLAKLQQALAAQPAIDQKRVDAISKALASGSYTMHVDRIAQGLIQSERALGQLTEM
jgi:flagellar biosynthesis anti-sigma factor FlgM